jgi:hypothetical protein
LNKYFKPFAPTKHTQKTNLEMSFVFVVHYSIWVATFAPKELPEESLHGPFSKLCSAAKRGAVTK